MTKAKDMTGKRFGKLSVIRRYGAKRRAATWWCICDCGVEKEVVGSDLRRGSAKSCGGCRADDISGQKFGELTAIEKVSVSSSGNAKWMCSCECGGERIAYTHALRKGTARDCGSAAHRVGRIVGPYGSWTKEYRSWKAMIRRCYDTSQRAYKRYGGRGITVCDRWKNNYEDFLKDMGRCPSDKTSIDRIDNDKGYSKSNCRWSTTSEQMNNTSNNVWFKFGRLVVTQTNLAAKLGINLCVIRKLRNLGYFDRNIVDYQTALKARKEILA